MQEFSLTCQCCGMLCKSIMGLARHISQAHNLKSAAYWDTYYHRSNCVICSALTNFESLGKGYSKTCSHTCGGKYFRAALRADENKQSAFINNIAIAQTAVWFNRTESVKQAITTKTISSNGYKNRKLGVKNMNKEELRLSDTQSMKAIAKEFKHKIDPSISILEQIQQIVNKNICSLFQMESIWLQ